MAYTQRDVDTLKKAIASGAMKVRFADGREVTYRSLADMRSVLAEMTAEATGVVRAGRFVAGYRPNLS